MLGSRRRLIFAWRSERPLTGWPLPRPLVIPEVTLKIESVPSGKLNNFVHPWNEGGP